MVYKNADMGYPIALGAKEDQVAEPESVSGNLYSLLELLSYRTRQFRAIEFAKYLAGKQRAIQTLVPTRLALIWFAQVTLNDLAESNVLTR